MLQTISILYPNCHPKIEFMSGLLYLRSPHVNESLFLHIKKRESFNYGN